MRDLRVILFVLLSFTEIVGRRRGRLCAAMDEILSTFVPSEILAFLDAFAKLRKATVSFVMSVRPTARSDWAPTGRILVTFNTGGVFVKSAEEIQDSLKSDKNNGVSLERPKHVSIISCSIIRRMSTVSDKNYRENQNTHFVSNNILCSKTFLFKKILCSKTFCVNKIFCSKKFSVQKHFVFNNILCSKTFLFKNIFCSKKFCVQ